MAWKASGRPTVSRADMVGMGGVFLHTSSPLPVGSVIELLFDLKTGDIRARASVRDSLPGKGMGLEFIQMQTDDRSRLNQFLSQNAREEARPFEAKQSRPGESIESKSVPERGKARSVRRCPFVASAEVTDLESGTKLSARTSELAVRGCYVDTLNPFPEGTVVSLRIVRDQGVFESKARVAYCQRSSGMGLSFIEMMPAQRLRLEDWLAAVVVSGFPSRH